MDNMICANLYGDSLLRFTVLDEAGRYRSLAAAFLSRLAERFGIRAVSRAHFGYTVDRGRKLLDRDLRAPLDCRYALLEYGGNDCDHDWKAVAAAPDAAHGPKTPLSDFTKTLSGMADDLAAAGAVPVFMTLPPIDAERYLAFIGRCGADARSVLRWLGDVQMIYRFHESYSDAVLKLAGEKGLPIVDVRSYFLDKHNYPSLLSQDGIHANEEGYALFFAAFEDFLAAHGFGT
ncbi:MAG TPA: GDSL-type esterase/lipase family protein [Oscillospiraceae bacterium]|nr:GDSL-type esterase/lipase family protein [Oscillospiraceae bacterium]